MTPTATVAPMLTGELAKIIRVFPRRTKWTPTDPLAFVGHPPLIRPDADEVHVSCTFTWDIPEAERLALAWAQHYPRVLLGGPAITPAKYVVPAFIPGMYLRRGVTFTTRGCNDRCPWCLVPEREGRLQVIDDFPEGPVIQDNNFLQATATHRSRVYQMLNRQMVACFTGGLDSALLTDQVADELRGVNLREVFLAADTAGSLKPLVKAIRRLSFLRDPAEDRKGEAARAIRCYVLIAYNGEGLAQAEARLDRVWELGAVPFAMLYQPPDRYINYRKEAPEWATLQRKWDRPAAMFASHRCSPATSSVGASPRTPRELPPCTTW